MSAPITIGVFDSGIGGLSVLQHIRHTLPHEKLLYVADSAHVPYGDKSPDYITQRSRTLTRFLMAQGADAIVIACNTATAAAAATLRSQFDLPIVGMEPAVKPAVAATQSGVVGVLATVGTLESARFAALLEKYAGQVKILTQGCLGLVELVERGDLHSIEARSLIERYTAPLLERGADTLILGCTHYPFLAPLIREVVGTEITLVDTGAAVARHLQQRIHTELPERFGSVRPELVNSVLPESSNPVRPEPVEGWNGAQNRPDLVPDKSALAQFFTSGDTQQSSRIMSRLWGDPVEAQPLPPQFSSSPRA